MSGVDPTTTIVQAILDAYSAFRFAPPERQSTIMAAIAIRYDSGIHVISVGTGSKCLPASRLPPEGNALHDSHAEVLARRGAMLWLYHELDRYNKYGSQWIESGPWGKLRLKTGLKLYLYVSTVPCGDASMRHLASQQDETMAAVKDATAWPTLAENAAQRGRDNYSQYGVLRTKPGRADSPPSISMSCSDKIASWSVLGIQGALLSRFFEPIYVDGIIIAGVDDAMQGVVREDCVRAFGSRLGSIRGLPGTYGLRVPSLHFTPLPFPHAKTSELGSALCGESLCWTADSSDSFEVLINGYRRGASPKHREKPKFWPRLCKARLFQHYQGLQSSPSPSLTYFHAKRESCPDYQQAKSALKGKSGPFQGWVVSGEAHENFLATPS